MPINLNPIKINVNEMVANLIEIERSRVYAPLGKQIQKADYEISVYGQVSSLVSTFSNSLSDLNNAFNLPALAVNSSDSSSVAATITGQAAIANHTLSVSQLAQAESMTMANATSSNNTPLNIAGDFNIAVGSQSVSVSIAASDTLQMIQQKINQQTGSLGVSANILSTNLQDGTPQYNLIISSNNTGLANKFTLSGSAATALNISTELSAAQDAKFTFDGNSVQRASNQVSDVLDGLSFNLLKQTSGTVTLSVTSSSDARNQAVLKAIHSVIDNYNQIVSFTDSNKNFIPVDGNNTPLFSDSLGRPIIEYDSTMGQIKDTLMTAFKFNYANSNSTVKSILDLGINLQTTQNGNYVQAYQTLTNKAGVSYTTSGSLSVNDTQLLQVMSNQFTDMKNFFQSTDQNAPGLLSKLKSAVDQLTTVGGTIQSHTQSLNNMESILNEKLNKESTRLEDLSKELKLKYTALNTLLSQLDATSQFINSQIDSWNSSSGK